MSNGLIKKYLNSVSQFMSLKEFNRLASFGETNFIERKSLRLFNNFKNDKKSIKDKLSQAMSAFGNYSGGFMLLGVTDNGEIEDGVDKIIDGVVIKEWLEDVLWTCCSPAFKDYSVKIVKKNKKFLYVIIFGKSSTAPNQANYNNKYYSRIDGKSRPIDGILVKDIFNRKKYTDLEISVDLVKIEDNSDNKANLEISITNKSNIVAEKVAILMNLSDKLINGGIHSGNAQVSANRGQFNVDLVYPNIDHDITGRQKIKLKDFNEFKLSFVIVAKNMPKKDSLFIVRNLEKMFSKKELSSIHGFNPKKPFAVVPAGIKNAI